MKEFNKAALASAAASLIISGFSADASAAHKMKMMPKDSPNTIMCMGINKCKGMAECKTASNICAGHNSCKGKGIVWTASTQDCADKGGFIAGSRKKKPEA